MVSPPGPVGACFDEIDHVAVMDRVRRRIKDRRLCNLVKAFLKAGILNDLGDREESLTGTHKGRYAQLRITIPYEQCWVMRSVRSSCLVRGWPRSARCA